MDLISILSPDAVMTEVKASCKRQAFQAIAEHLSGLPSLGEISTNEILDTLLDREKLGSTSVGNGIAIPHGRLDALEDIVAGFVQLAEPIEFEATDSQNVDLLFILLAPEKAGAEHLNALAKIARIMRTEGVSDRLRNLHHPKEIFDLLVEGSTQSSAA